MCFFLIVYEMKNRDNINEDTAGSNLDYNTYIFTIYYIGWIKRLIYALQMNI